MQWLGKAHKPKKAYVVHGEPEGQLTMKNRMESELGWDVVIPKSHQVFEV
jgi:metallo-beta-lactamase family protein